MIKHTLMALSEAGTQADVDIIRDHYQEDWWLQARNLKLHSVCACASFYHSSNV